MAKTDAESSFLDGLEKLSGVLSGVADQLYQLADSYSTSEEELAELNAGKTAEEIAEEDALAAEIAAPLVNALDGISDILNNAALKVMEMTAEQSGSNG